MKHDEQWLSQVREVLVAGIDDKSHAHTLSDAMQQACKEYAEVMSTQLTAELAERDRRVGELEDALKTLHRNIYKMKYDAGKEYGSAVHEYEPHPLLVKGEG